MSWEQGAPAKRGPLASGTVVAEPGTPEETDLDLGNEEGRARQERPAPGTEAIGYRELPQQVTVPALPSTNGDAVQPRAVLAVFCFEEPESLIGQHVARTVTALTQRHTDVHLFCRTPFSLDLGHGQEHALGLIPGDDILAQAHEFAHRACNRFLQTFAANCGQVRLLGYEWSVVPTLSMLRGVKNLRSSLSLHSLERQRSDMSSPLSREIWDIELTGLREAKSILVQDPSITETAKYWSPQCLDRVVEARRPFPVERFQRDLDPGEIKAKYDVGPVDPTLLYIGDLDESYGPDLLLKAMPALLKDDQQIRLIVAGYGEQFWPLRVYSRYLLLDPAVRLLGNVEGSALDDLIQAADVIVVPSRKSTPWWPILAGWAAGRPVVATHEAAPELVEHERDSVLFYPAENSCVWGVQRVLFDPSLRQELVLHGREKLEERFGWNIVAEQVEHLMGVAK
jgi:glycosyltransferase involved in cell wall biosynthesis